MSRPMRVAVMGLLAASVAFAAGQEAGPAWQSIIPEAEFGGVVAEAGRTVEKDLAVADKDPQARARARGTALLVAAYAQGSIKGEDAEARTRAALRDAALKLAVTIGNKDFGEAAMLARALPTVRPTDGTKTAAPPLVKTDDRDDLLPDLMALLKPRVHGGLGVQPKPADPKQDGIDPRLDLLANRRLTKDDLDKQADGLALTAYQAAAVADLAYALSPEKKEGAKDPKDWRRWSRAVREASADLAEAVRMKDPERVRKAAGRAVGACNDCHKVFRD